MRQRTEAGQGLKLAAEDDRATDVYDNGRRGNPRPGCDCIQCFGYCMIDGDKAHRDVLMQGRPEKDDFVLDRVSA